MGENLCTRARQSLTKGSPRWREPVDMPNIAKYLGESPGTALLKQVDERERPRSQATAAFGGGDADPEGLRR